MKKHSIRRWIILCFTGIFIFSLAISAVANYLENARSVSTAVNENLARCAASIDMKLREMDPDGPDITEGSREYQEIMTFLHFCATIFDANNLIIYRLDPETRIRYIVIYAAGDLETENANKPYCYPGATVEGPLLPVEEQWLAGEENAYGACRDGEKTTWILPSVNGYLIALDADIRMEKQTVLRSFLWDIIPIGLALMLGLLILLILVRRRIIRPIGLLSDNMKQFTHDGSPGPDLPVIRSEDEIREIAEAYTRMTKDIHTYVSSIETLTKEKLETDVQLDVARRIQNGLVPERTDLNGAGFSVSAMTRPARAVGGDFYDCFLRDQGSVCVVMGDVSGKGISAAFFMAMAKTMIREKLMAGLSPATALNQANDELCGQNPEGLFATVFAAVLNPRSGELVYANAGHTRPVLLRSAPVLMSPDPGIALGLFEDADIREYPLSLAPSEGILLYTDGVTEAVSPSRQFFGEERLLETLNAVPAGTDAEGILYTISRAVAGHCEGGEPFDDTAGLVLLRTPAGADRRMLAVDLSSFDTIRQTVFAEAGESPETRRALLACDEALTYIVNYSGATELAFSCGKTENSLRVTFSDNGIPFDPTAAARPEKSFDELDSGGMGLEMIRQSASGMHYERRRDRNELTLDFAL